MNCPSCNSADIHARGKRYALYPSGIVAVIGWPFAMLHQVSTPHEYQCNQCGAAFFQRTTAAKIARVFLYICGIVFALLIVAMVVLIIAG